MKARLKTIILSALSTVAAFSTITYNSCTSDKCKAIACAYGGVCKDGTCICPSGYEGVQCETITRTKFFGTYTVTETGTLTSSATYTVSIEAATNNDITNVKIKNFYNQIRGDVIGYVNADTLYINNQIVDGDTIQGTGVLIPDTHYVTHGKLVMRYMVKDGHTNYFGYDSTGTPSVWLK